MAAAPAPSDARVPCPLCGGLIHPIAGRCKHCKADLSRHQAPRPASSTPLPALLAASTAAPSTPTSPYAPGAKATPDAPPSSTAAELPPAARTVLPPRPSESSTNVSSWRSWPVIVIVLAMAAIIVAVVLMVWPAKPRDPGTRSRGTEPAPERMQTQPELAPHAAPTPNPSMPPPARDPWADDPGPQGSAAPDPDDDSQTSVDPAIPDIDDVPAPTARPQGRRPGPGGQSAVMFSMISRMCHKLAQCGSIDSNVAGLCSSMGRLGAAPPASCPAAERCLAHIDTLPCGMVSDDVGMLTTLMAKFQDCADATRC